MTDIASIALTGFFVWSGMTGPLAVAETPAQVLIPATEKTHSVRLTAYNAVPEQTDSTPFVTASGIPTNPEITAARSQDLAVDLPFGTVIALESPAKSNSCGFSTVQHLIGYRVISDTMHERMKKKIDILLDEKDLVLIGVNGQSKRAINPARALGICTVTARVVGKIDIKDVPDSQAELALLVNRTLAAK